MQPAQGAGDNLSFDVRWAFSGDPGPADENPVQSLQTPRR
jgi:hypothetical protein